jgi:hypothetical protein
LSLFYKITILFIAISLSFGQTQFNWIIPNKPYLKLFTNDDGIYRINKADFIQAGINTNFDPRTVKVYYKGTQIPIYFEGESDGSFDDTDFFDFYGTRNYGGLTNTYRDTNGVMVVDYVTNEYYNQYSDTNVFWVGWEGAFGLRFLKYTYNSQINYTQNYFLDKIHFEQDLFYTLGETFNPNADFRYFNNEKVTGEGWFWVSMFNGTSVSSTFSIPYLAPGPAQCSFRIFAFPNSKDSSINEHKIVLKVNNTPVTTLVRTHYDKFDTTVNFSSSLLASNNSNTISATYTPSFTNQSLTPNVNFDLMEIQYPRIFQFQNNQISFDIGGSDTVTKVYKVIGIIASNPLSIYDVRNNLKITSYSINSDTLFFAGKGNGNFQVINKYITKKPFKEIQKQVPDLISSNNGADYIVIYNNLFSSQAEQLRSHRAQADSLRATKIDVDDIIDIFNYGLMDPVAIRYFLNYVYFNWQQPSIKYVCLFGRGSLDPKNNLQSPNYYLNLIPVYGNPQTDGYFGNLNFGTFTYYQKIAIGRLPAYTQTEAQNMVNKIIAYDNNQPDLWWKTFIMITGGSSRNDQIQFQYQANQFIGSYLQNPPLSMKVDKIYRNDSLGYITYNYSDSIKNEINRGGLIINFIGHAASQDWELGLQDPNSLNNGYKDPLVLSMTCFTGKNSEPNTRSFGEEFLYLPNKCAVGFIGSSGWSFAAPGNTLNGYILEAFSNDSLRRIGDILKSATFKLASDSNSFASRNTINCYNLLGDPATKLLLPRLPDFDIEQNDYKLSDQYPAVKEQVNLTVYPKNLGTYADSCKLRFQILRNTVNYQIKDTILRNFAYFDTANFTFKLDTIGNYIIKVILDADDWYPNENKTNNIIQIQIPLRNTSFLPIKPINNSIIKDDSVQIVGLNPDINPRTNNIKIILQIDTSKNFINPIYSAYNTNIIGVVSRFNYHLQFLDSSKVYLWRSNVIINNDSTGWSSTQRFIYNPSISNAIRSGKQSLNRSSMSRTLKTNRYGKNLIYDSSVIIYTSLPNQFDNSDLNNVHYTGSGFELMNFTGNLTSKSYGSNGFEASFLIINGLQIYADGGQNTGMTIAKVSKPTGKLIQFKNFRMLSSQSSDSVLNFLNSFDTTQYVMVMIASTYPNVSDTLRQNVKIKFKQFGSIYADSIYYFSSFDTWAFIGFLGAPGNKVSEEFHRWPTVGCQNYWCPSNANLNPTFLNANGYINFSIGPGHRWKNFSWDGILYPNSSIKYDVSGIGQNLDTTIIYSNITNSGNVSLDSLSSYQFPYLKLAAKLSIDTLNAYKSPSFRMMNFKYTPPAEIAPDNYSFIRSDTNVQEGKLVTFSVRNYNVGYVPANVIMNKWYAVTSNGTQILKIDTVTTPLYVDSSRISSVTFSTMGLRNRQRRIDTISIFYEPTILGGVNDFYPFNNFALSNLVITGDSLPPSIDVTYDGQKILNGDIITAKPYIIYKFSENNFLQYTIDDTSNIFIKQDNILVRYFVNGQPNPEISFTAINNHNLKVQVNYQPTLSEGSHIFQYVGRDKNGNYSDTLTTNVLVSYAFSIKDLYNIPNPTRGETYFTFLLYAQKNPQACKIKIYTVAGRLIKEINSIAKVGFNSIYWDGRDQDGDSMANGIYLYKLILQDGNNTTTSIQKLAILR